jgi:hypothetical protein
MKLILGFVLGLGMSVAAQQIVTIPSVPARPAQFLVRMPLDKQRLNLHAGDRLVVCVNPASFTAGAAGSLFDLTIAAGNSMTGNVSVNGSLANAQ